MQRPNILMIMADQFRAEWMGCAGASFVDTPHIDSIARKGTRFSNAVCNSPLCAPSRASLAAGVYPHRLGILDNAVNFPADRTTYYQLLRKSGYRVSVIGKTDLHKPDHYYGENGDLPFLYHLGFTDVLDTEGKMGAAQSKTFEFKKSEADSLVGPYQRYLASRDLLDGFIEDYRKRMRQSPVWYADKSVLEAKDYHDSYIGINACKYIEKVSNESPWHLFVSFVGPHDPWDAPKEYLDLFKAREFPAPIQASLEGKPDWIKAKQKKHATGAGRAEYIKVKQNYAAMIELIDDWVGKILETLDRRGLRDNTVIIFCSDHGEMMGDHGLFRKSVMYEGAVRIPLIISKPGSAKMAESDAIVELVDLAPTILELAAAGYDSNRMDGRSLVPILDGKSAAHKRYQISELQNTRMISDGRYKFIESYNDRNELYDMERDREELENIIEQAPGIAAELYKKLKQLRK